MKYKKILHRFFHLHPVANPLPEDEVNSAQEIQQIISGELHDIIAPGLLLIRMQTKEMRMKAGLEDISPYSEAILRTADELVRHTREMIWALNPRNGLLDNIVNFISECFLYGTTSSSLEAHIHYPDMVPDIDLPLPLIRCLIRCTKEATDFMVRNSGGTRADLHIYVTEEHIRVRICDCGADEALSNGECFRVLSGLERRIAAVGGTCSIFSSQAGTNVWFQAPFLNY
jgi:signal transduction histidine kinase